MPPDPGAGAVPGAAPPGSPPGPAPRPPPDGLPPGGSPLYDHRPGDGTHGDAPLGDAPHGGAPPGEAPPGSVPEAGATYRRLFAAYVLALLGTGIAVVALALLAYDLAGAEAGTVIATALSIKAAAYVVVAPVGAALAGRADKRALMIVLDLVRAAAILTLPFAAEPWHVYLAVLVFTAASALFTPTYQAVVPQLLADPEDYRRAVAKSRLAAELENALSPMIAAALLLVVATRGLLVASMAALVLSALVLWRIRLPAAQGAAGRPVLAHLARGPALIAMVPQLRALVPLTLAAALGTAMVMVNTVVIVQGGFGLGERAVAAALAVFGAGTVAGVAAMPAAVGRFGERRTMLAGAALVAAGLAAGALAMTPLTLLPLWAAIGLGSGLALTPAPVLLRRHAPDDSRGPLYAAHFSLGNACLLVGYGLAGLVPAGAGMPSAFALSALLTAGAALAASAIWRPVPAP